MPKREVMTKVSITFTDSEWEELCNLYQNLDELMDNGEQYPELTDPEFNLLINNLQRTLDSLLVNVIE